MSSQTMWALVKDKPEVGLTMKRVEIPQVGDNDVKIKIHKTAICGTDVHIYQWNEWAQHTIAVGQTAGHDVAHLDGYGDDLHPFDQRATVIDAPDKVVGHNFLGQQGKHVFAY